MSFCEKKFFSKFFGQPCTPLKSAGTKTRKRKCGMRKCGKKILHKILKRGNFTFLESKMRNAEKLHAEMRKFFF